MSDLINKRFVHLTHDATGKTLFNDGLGSSAEHYFALTGSTAEEATLVQATLTSNETYNGLRGYTVIPPTAVVFVDFPDGTTAIISHMKFYSKLDELGGGETPTFNGIRVLDGYSDLPNQSSEDLGLTFGDVCAVKEVYSGTQIVGFKIAVCTGAQANDNGSGQITYRYSWQVVYSWPEIPDDWETATTPLGS